MPVYSAVANETAVGKSIEGLSTNKESQYILQLLPGSTNPKVFTIDSKLNIDISANSNQTGISIRVGL